MQVAQVSRVVLVAASSSTARIVSTSSAAVRASAGEQPTVSSATRDGAERLGLGDHGLALSSVPLLRLIAIGDNVLAELGREGRVICAELVVGGDRAARIAIAEPGGAERSGHE